MSISRPFPSQSTTEKSFLMICKLKNLFKLKLLGREEKKASVAPFLSLVFIQHSSIHRYEAEMINKGCDKGNEIGG
jgi:hypothetical protein